MRGRKSRTATPSAGQPARASRRGARALRARGPGREPRVPTPPLCGEAGRPARLGDVKSACAVGVAIACGSPERWLPLAVRAHGRRACSGRRSAPCQSQTEGRLDERCGVAGTADGHQAPTLGVSGCRLCSRWLRRSTRDKLAPQDAVVADQAVPRVPLLDCSARRRRARLAVHTAHPARPLAAPRGPRARRRRVFLRGSRSHTR